MDAMNGFEASKKQLSEVAKVASTELEQLERSALEHTLTAIDAAGLGAKAVLSFGRELAAAWRRVAVAAVIDPG